MHRTCRRPLSVLLVALVAPACAPDPGALSTTLSPKQPPDHYRTQASKYFDTLDSRAPPDSVPSYALRVARWEWPPWLLLTGYGRDQMIALDQNVVRAMPSMVPVRDCRAFAVQPFARCRVTFQYAQGTCPIYEEFTFNDQGETTFIEAWSDRAGLLPAPNAADAWAEGAGVHRLSTKIPGLGNATGQIDLDAEEMMKAARADPEIADFVARAEDPIAAWLQANRDAGPDYFKKGCGW